MSDTVVTAFALSRPGNEYQWDKCRVFVKSLRRYGYEGDILLWGRDFNEDTLKQFDHYQVETRDPGEPPPDLWINGARFFAYFHIAQEDKWEKIFLFDVRDIVFQGNPYEGYANGLHVFAEDEKICENRINAAWIIQFFGLIGYQLIGDNAISCAGTIFGDRKSILNYCGKQMYFSSLYPPVNDQGVHNWILRSKMLPFIWHENSGKALVWTVGTKPQTADWYRLDGHRVQTVDHFTPCIVHQYDRHDTLLSVVEREYAD